MKGITVSLGLSPLPVRVTAFLVGNPYKPSFPLLLGGGTTQSITYKARSRQMMIFIADCDDDCAHSYWEGGLV